MGRIIYPFFIFIYNKKLNYKIMDIKNSVEYRFDEYKKYDFLGDNKYDYAKDGILIRCLPKILFKGNSIFVTYLQLIDLRLITMFKYIDKIKQFKYISWY